MRDSLNILICLIMCLIGSDAVYIRKLSVPRSFQSGSVQYVVLDCEFSYDSNDIKLVVKWFFNDIAEPVYQYIPEIGFHGAFGPLQDRVDTKYNVRTRDPHFKYRAVRILHPTFNLTGKYTCEVSSLAGQDSRSAEMIIYEGAKSFTLHHNSTSRIVACKASGLHPQPELRLVSMATGNPKAVEGAHVETHKVNGTYDISLSWKIPPGDMRIVNDTLVCLLAIPGTQYVATKKISLNEHLYPNAYGTTNCASVRGSHVFLILCILLTLVV